MAGWLMWRGAASEVRWGEVGWGGRGGNERERERERKTTVAQRLATCFKTPPLAFVNCSCAQDGLSTMLQPSLKPQRYQPPSVAAASIAVGDDMNVMAGGDGGVCNGAGQMQRRARLE